MDRISALTAAHTSPRRRGTRRSRNQPRRRLGSTRNQLRRHLDRLPSKPRYQPHRHPGSSLVSV